MLLLWPFPHTLCIRLVGMMDKNIKEQVTPCRVEPSKQIYSDNGLQSFLMHVKVNNCTLPLCTTHAIIHIEHLSFLHFSNLEQIHEDVEQLDQESLEEGQVWWCMPVILYKKGRSRRFMA
jgi:hypothetical protein